MIFVLSLFAICLGFAAWRARGGSRGFLIACLVLNLAAGVVMLRDADPYAWKLAPHRTAPGIEDPLPPPAPPRP